MSKGLMRDYCVVLLKEIVSSGFEQTIIIRHLKRACDAAAVRKIHENWPRLGYLHLVFLCLLSSASNGIRIESEVNDNDAGYA